MRFNKLIYYLFILSCFFPFLNFFRIPTDSQPNSLLLSLIIISINFKAIRQHFPAKFLLFIFIIFIALTLLFASNLSVNSIISFIGYISLFLIPLATYISLLKIGGLPRKFLFNSLIIWGIVAIIQRFVNPEFMSFILYRSSGAGLMGRGVNSLAPEPTYYGTVLVLFLIIYFLNFRWTNIKLHIIFIVFQLIFLSLSSTIFAVLLISYFLFVLFQMVKIKLDRSILFIIIGIICIVNILFLMFNDYILETRIYKITEILLTSPEIILMDESINERFNHAFFPLVSLFDNYGLPMGFDNFQQYILSKVVDDKYSIFFDNIQIDHYKKIMSAYGSIFFELGVIGLIIPYFLYSIYKPILSVKIHLFSFFLLNLLLFTSISLNNSLVLFVFGNVLFFKKNKYALSQ